METDKRDFVGIDPDSKGFEVYVFKEGFKGGRSLHCKTSSEGMQKAIKWIAGLHQPVIGIEGLHGWSWELERWLLKEGLTYYSIPANKIIKYRQAAVSQNKNNQNDAEAVALFVENMHRQGKLDEFAPKLENNYELRQLTRMCIAKSQEETATKNRLWKVINKACPDLYLFLSGDTDVEDKTRLDKLFVLNLLLNQPDLSHWKEMKNQEWYQAFGGHNFKSRESILLELKKSTINVNHQDISITLVISQLAEDILKLKKHQQALKNLMIKQTNNNEAVKLLESWKGIGNYTASCLIAEILDIRRFKNDDSLASYSGLGKRQHNTGDKESMRSNWFYNRYLKYVMINAAMLFVKYNNESGFAFYYKHLLKKGMKKIEARKRIGRAFLRKIYRELKQLVLNENNEKSGMANEGSKPNGLLIHDSNIPSSRIDNKEVAAKSQTKKRAEIRKKMLC